MTNHCPAVCRPQLTMPGGAETVAHCSEQLQDHSATNHHAHANCMPSPTMSETGPRAVLLYREGVEECGLVRRIKIPGASH